MIISKNYLSISTTLSFAGNIKIDAGQYNYDFQCKLPSGMPSSVEAETGHIRYLVRVVMDLQMWPNKEFVEPITIVKQLHLNEYPSMRVSSHLKIEFPFAFFLMESLNPRLSAKQKLSVTVRRFNEAKASLPMLFLLLLLLLLLLLATDANHRPSAGHRLCARPNNSR